MVKTLRTYTAQLATFKERKNKGKRDDGISWPKIFPA